MERNFIKSHSVTVLVYYCHERGNNFTKLQYFGIVGKSGKETKPYEGYLTLYQATKFWASSN